jgi:hypothetical protein
MLIIKNSIIPYICNRNGHRILNRPIDRIKAAFLVKRITIQKTHRAASTQTIEIHC